MNKLYLLTTALLILAGLSISKAGDTASVKSKNPVKLYILAGQSNAVGYNNMSEFHGDRKKLDSRLEKTSHVLFWPGSNARKEYAGRWIMMRSGVSGISGSSPYDEGCFGPEIGFAMKMEETFQGEEIAIIKFADGGSGIARSSDYSDYIPALKGFDDKGINWHPQVEAMKAGQLYIDLLQNIRVALSALKKDGIQYQISGFLWMQGEHEAGISKKMAADYQDLLTLFIKSVRIDLGVKDLPFIIGEINSHAWAFGDLAREKQAYVCAANPKAVLVKTVDLPRNGVGGKAHFDADGMIELGERFAAAMSLVGSEEGDREEASASDKVPPPFNTRLKMLWDERYFYFAAEMKETDNQ